jgi:thiol:disulfide interchange protein
MNKLGSSLIGALALVHWVSAAEATWLTELGQAQATAKQGQKMVLLEFTGSDWCSPCKALHTNVLISAEFVEFTKANLVLMLVDFPHGKKLPVEQEKANEALAKKYQIEVVPTVIVLDSTGRQISKEVGYNGSTAKEFVANLQKLKSRASVQKATQSEAPTERPPAR